MRPHTVSIAIRDLAASYLERVQPAREVAS